MGIYFAKTNFKINGTFKEKIFKTPHFPAEVGWYSSPVPEILTVQPPPVE